MSFATRSFVPAEPRIFQVNGPADGDTIAHMVKHIMWFNHDTVKGLWPALGTPMVCFNGF
jgi:hypothetical protein